ncbi:MAG: hypothetical protein RI958_2882 [Actinomycetota bacterium]
MTLVVEGGLDVGTLSLDIDATFAAGSTVAVLGPNGAGKSTLLRTLAGLTPLQRGRITLDGSVLDDPDDGTFVRPERRPIGVVFQNYLLFDHLSVVDNVAFGLRARGVRRTDARRVAHEWIERMGLADHATHRPRALSGGQAQRVALARALAVEPRLVLLDEPLAALDAGTRAAVRRELRRHLSGVDGVRLVVTHDPVDAHVLADEVIVVEHGAVVQRGTLTEVSSHPRSRYVADLVGVNLVEGTVEAGVLRTTSGARLVIADAPDGPSLAVIHPHSISVARDEAPGSSPRNRWPGTVTEIDHLGTRARLRVGGALPLTAEITAAALADLRLASGDPVVMSVKATDITVYPA